MQESQAARGRGEEDLQEEAKELSAGRAAAR
jgi:hypothetical protein